MDSLLRKIFQKIVFRFKEIFYFLNLSFKKHFQLFILILVIIGALGAILYGIASIFFPPPETVVKLFYESLEKKDFNKSFSYILPEEREKLENKLEYLKLIAETDFKDLSFHLLERKNNQAVVEVKGSFEVKTKNLKEEGKINQKIQLVRKGGRWYIASLSQK